MRLDVHLSTSHAFTRNKAQQLIEVGLVSVNGKVIQKASFDVGGDDIILVQEDKRVHWVSRSAEKLDGFLQKLQIHEQERSVMSTIGDILPTDIESKISHTSKGQMPIKIAGANCLDVGSSTGGFTQVLLEHGAAHVDAVDVGTDQLHPSLRSDPRVTSYEQTDIRDFASNIPRYQLSNTPPYDIIVCDASFISLTDIIDAILECASDMTDIILLYKPQFEVGPKNLRKTGVPKDEKCILDSMYRFETTLRDRGCKILQKEKSTLIGEAGNQEWVYLIRRINGLSSSSDYSIRVS